MICHIMNIMCRVTRNGLSNFVAKEILMIMICNYIVTFLMISQWSSKIFRALPSLVFAIEALRYVMRHIVCQFEAFWGIFTDKIISILSNKAEIGLKLWVIKSRSNFILFYFQLYWKISRKRGLQHAEFCFKNKAAYTYFQGIHL